MADKKVVEKKVSTKLGLADMLGEAGVDVSVVKLSKKGFKAGTIFGVKEPMSEKLLAFAKRGGVKTAFAVMDKKYRSGLSKEAQEEAKKMKVVVIDWKVARLACMSEVDRMQKNLGRKPTVVDADVADEYGVYRTNDKGQFVVAQKLTQGRKPQMIGVVNRLKGKLDLKDVDYYNAGEDNEPVLVVGI